MSRLSENLFCTVRKYTGRHIIWIIFLLYSHTKPTKTKLHENHQFQWRIQTYFSSAKRKYNINVLNYLRKIFSIQIHFLRHNIQWNIQIFKVQFEKSWQLHTTSYSPFKTRHKIFLSLLTILTPILIYSLPSFRHLLSTYTSLWVGPVWSFNYT